MKRSLALALSVVMVLTVLLTGCGSGSENAAKDASTQQSSTQPAASATAAAESSATSVVTPAEKVKIGFIGWSYTDTLGASYKRYFEYMQDAFNIEYNLVTGLTTEEIVKATENLIQAGCKAITSYIVTNTMMDMCDKAGVYLTQFGSPISDPELKAYLEKSKYWAGTSAVDDYEAGAKMVESLYNAGTRNIILCAPASGNFCHDIRFKAVKETVAKHKDMKILVEYRNADATTYGSAVQNAIAVYPELDGVIATGASQGGAESIIQTLDTEGKSGKVRFASLDVIDKTKEYLEDGTLTFIGGGQYPEVVMLTLCMYDKVNGKSTAEGPVDLVGKFIYIEGAEGYDKYSKFIEGDVFPFTIEELQSVVTTTNPKATYKDLWNMWNSYNLDDVMKRHANLVK